MFLRADRAHASIIRIGIDTARRQPGVIDIVTGDDVMATGWKGPASMSFFKGVGGSSLRVPFRAALAHGRVRFVGEPVALVVAETEHQAQDAAELIEVEYEDLPVVVEAADGISADSVRLHPDLPDNLAFDYEYGDRQSTDHGFEQAAHIVRVGLRARYNDNSISKFSGTGSFGSRWLISHGAGFATAAKEIVQKGLKLAAGHFEVSTGTSSLRVVTIALSEPICPSRWMG